MVSDVGIFFDFHGGDASHPREVNMANNLDHSSIGKGLDELVFDESQALLDAGRVLGQSDLGKSKASGRKANSDKRSGLRSQPNLELASLSSEKAKRERREKDTEVQSSVPVGKGPAGDTAENIPSVGLLKTPPTKPGTEGTKPNGAPVPRSSVEELLRAPSKTSSETSRHSGSRQDSETRRKRSHREGSVMEVLMGDADVCVQSQPTDQVQDLQPQSPGEQTATDFYADIRRHNVGAEMTASEVTRWTAPPAEPAPVLAPARAATVNGTGAGKPPQEILQEWRRDTGPALLAMLDKVEKMCKGPAPPGFNTIVHPSGGLDARPEERKRLARERGPELVEMVDCLSNGSPAGRPAAVVRKAAGVARVARPTGVSRGPMATVLDHERPPSDVPMENHRDRCDAFKRGGRARELPEVLRGLTPVVAVPKPLGDVDEVQSAFERHKSASAATPGPLAPRGENGSVASGRVRNLAESVCPDATGHWLASEGKRMAPQGLPVNGDGRTTQQNVTKPVQEKQRQRGRESKPDVKPEQYHQPSRTGTRSPSTANTVIERTPVLPAGTPPEQPSAASPPLPIEFTPGPVNRAKLHSFAGDGQEDWSAYAVHVSMVASANRWDAQLTKVMLLTALTGSALRYMSTVPSLSTATLAEVVDMLREEFEKKPVPRMTVIAQLNSRVQGPKESYQDLAKSIRSLVLQAYPNLDPAARVDAACIRFREAIRNKDVRFYVEHLRYYETLQDLVDEAELVSRIHPRSGQTYPPIAAAVHTRKREKPGRRSPGCSRPG